VLSKHLPGPLTFPQPIILSVKVSMEYYSRMDEEIFRKVFSELGKRGGKARAAALTAKERKAIATKASKAAAKARTLKAKARAKST
jgi:hypothetical protein